MATTDARTGFRLPWSTDQRSQNDEPTADDGTTSRADAAGVDSAEPATGQASDQPTHATPEETTMIEARADDAGTAVDDTAGSTPSASHLARRPSKFLADLTRAMQAAAESAREETLGRLQADAKAHIEEIHARSSTDAADLRRRADDDVAAIRDWSKSEIARIREETDRKIAERKGRLEFEIEEHAARIERQIERVQGRITGFEAEMARFFENLLAEDDPSRFASMAENLPEPPPFDVDEGTWSPRMDTVLTDVPSIVTVDEVAPIETEPETEAEPETEFATEPMLVAVAETVAEIADASTPEVDGEVPLSAVMAESNTTDDAEAAMAAIQAAAEAAEWGATDRLAVSNEPDPVTTETDETDPRLAALATADFAAAEAEAAVAAGASDEAEEIPTIADDALAARLAGLVPPMDDETPRRSDGPTQVVVSGLVSVASIASFKRHLGRLPGVQSVGVSSGPEGEFIFAVNHGPEVVLREAVPSLPGFQARVTGGNDGTIEVTARDPESEA